ncbi:MAG: hypothetical protein IPL36_03240 [Nigerium sp.]|nr:hypothetical protein [Nigerium sp.]
MVAGLLGAGAWWFVVRPAQVLDARVDRVVAGLASGDLPDADLTTPPPTNCGGSTPAWATCVPRSDEWAN